jgi:hypothetical protein
MTWRVYSYRNTDRSWIFSDGCAKEMVAVPNSDGIVHLLDCGTSVVFSKFLWLFVFQRFQDLSSRSRNENDKDPWEA